MKRERACEWCGKIIKESDGVPVCTPCLLKRTSNPNNNKEGK